MTRHRIVQLAAGVLAACGAFGAARAEAIYGLTNLQELVTFDSQTRSVTSTTPLSGFSITGEILLSIDVRPATGELYGLSSANQLYRIDPTTGASAAVGSGLGATLTGSAKAIDFNPTVDRIRILTSSGQNLRAHPDTGALVATDGSHAFAAGDPNAGDSPAVVNGAYTNSFLGATTTTLYTLEAGNNVLATQIPPNNGVLNTVGGIGFDLVDSGGFTGFDISGSTGTAYLVGNSLFGGGLTANSLYTVDLTTGLATLAGPVSGVNGSFRDLAVVPEPSSFVIAALAGVGFAFVAARRRLR